jgi:ankyrin repeat protein
LFEPKQASGNSEATALLIKLGANFNAVDNESRNLLHCAVEAGELPSGVDLSRFLFSPDAEGLMQCQLLFFCPKTRGKETLRCT